MARKRYYSEDDIEAGVTPSRLKRLSRAKQIQYLVWWFNSMYEDPAQETPYNSEEGGYLYIWGGPYAADEELYDEFGSFISEEVIQSAVEEVTSDGIFDWAPGHNHPDHKRDDEDYEDSRDERQAYEVNFDEIMRQIDSGQAASFGDDWERSKRREIIQDLNELELHLPVAVREHGGMGHNQPPEQYVLSEDRANLIREAASIIRGELSRDEPDAKSVANAASIFRSALSWTGKKIDKAADEFASTFGKSLGATAAIATTAYFSGVGPIIGRIWTNTIEWLGHVMSML